MALCALEEVLGFAQQGPVRRSWGVRLALAMLVRGGIAEPWQANQFWSAMADAIPGRWSPDDERYIRTTLLSGALDNWHYGAGLEPPDAMERARRAAALPLNVDSMPDCGQPSDMCNRAERGDTDHIRRLFGAELERPFNDGPLILYPKAPAPVVRCHEGRMVISQMTWGLPLVMKGKKGQPLKPKPVNNARFDKLGSFWKRWTGPTYRCLLPTARYAEAVGDPGHMTEAWLSIPEMPIFAWAGLWGTSLEWGDWCTGVMTDNAPELAHIHDRSPVILEPADWSTWLNAPLGDLYQFDRPFPAQRMMVEITDTPWVRRA